MSRRIRSCIRIRWLRQEFLEEPRAASPIQAAPAPLAVAPIRTVKPPPPPPPRKQQQPALPLQEVGWQFPSLDLLTEPPARGSVGPSEESLQANARLLETVLSDYGVQGEIVEIRPGPVVTLYELVPAPGIRSARVIGLADDIARSLSVTAVRIATVTGRNVIGIEVPNSKRETVFLSEILSSEEVTEVLRPAVAGPGQGHQRQGDRRRPGADAASDDRGHHRVRQIGRRQRDDPVAAVSHVARPVPVDPDRSEDAGTVDLRGHPASDGAGGDRTGESRDGTEMDRAGDGKALPRDEPAGCPQRRRLQRPRGRGARQGRGRYPQGADRFRPRHRPPDVRGAAAGLGAPAVHCRRGRRNGRPDDGRRQGDRAGGAASGPDGSGGRDSRDHGDAAAVGGCHYGHNQGQLPDPHQLPGDFEIRQPHHPGRAGRRTVAGHGRHAVHAGRRPGYPRAWPVRVG